MTPIVEAAGLAKRFGAVEALAGLDLVADPGQVVAPPGPNGAGKTTFVRSVATLVRPDRARSGWTASTPSASPAGCGGSSASPASSRPSRRR